MTKTERKVMEAFWNSHQQDRFYWHRDGVAAALREVINQLQKYGTIDVIELEQLCGELEDPMNWRNCE
jgi:hypothetical protein